MLGNRRILVFCSAALMQRNPVAFAKYLHRVLHQPCRELLACKCPGCTVEVPINFYVIIKGQCGKTPFTVFKGFCRKRQGIGFIQRQKSWRRLSFSRCMGLSLILSQVPGLPG